jgi:hypothetical protein
MNGLYIKVKVMNLKDLQKIETKTIRGERNFELKTALMKIFKALRGLFDDRKDVPEKKVVNRAKAESRKLGLEEDKYNWNEIFTLKEVNQSVEQHGKQLTFSNGNSYPDNFYVGKAIANGSCFFDSFRHGLEQQKGIKVTVEQLRMNCLEFVFDNASEEGWFKNAIANSYDNNGQRRSENLELYGASILENDRWGDPEVEGRILCEKYGVKLHVVENNPLKAIDNQQDPFLHQLIDNRGSKSAGEYNKVDYNDSNVLHMINKGGAHFEPLLDKNKSLTRQPQEQRDFLFARELQEKEDHLLAKQFQEKEDYLLAKQLQKQENSSFVKRPFQEHSDRLLAAKLQKEEIDLFTKDFPRQNPKCSSFVERVSLAKNPASQLVK